jgi:hypothetical protein
LRLLAASLPRNTTSDMSLPYVSEAWGWGTCCLGGCGPCRSGRFGNGLCCRFLTSQDARMRGDSHDEAPMEPTMYGRFAIAMTTTVSRMHVIPDGDDCDNEPMSWARLDVACGSQALTESEPLITTALAMLPPQRLTVARAGCGAEARSNSGRIAWFLDSLPSLVPLSGHLSTDIFPKLQADINERVNLLRFAMLAPTFSNRARPESRRISSQPRHPCVFGFGPA